MNILSFDIEEWYIEKFYGTGNNYKYDSYDVMLNKILELLDHNSVKATFFCLGALAEYFPYVVKKIAKEGHEIACHSLNHKWVNKQTYVEFYNDTYKAINDLQGLTGNKVKSFRAPAFSICEYNKWAFEVLARCGIENDASIFPGIRDFGGFPNFSQQKPCIIEYKGFRLNEFPIPLYRLPIINTNLAYSGGGYFRILPLSFVKNRMESSEYNMCYFHIADLLSEKSPMMSRDEFEKYFKESGSFPNRLVRYLKSNVGRTKAWDNLDSLLSIFKFTSIEGYLLKNSINKTVTI